MGNREDRIPGIGNWVELTEEQLAGPHRRCGLRLGAIGQVIPPNEAQDTGRILIRPYCLCMVTDEAGNSKQCQLAETDQASFLNRGEYRVLEDSEAEALKAPHHF